MYKYLLSICAAALICLAPTCNTPKVGGEVTAIAYTDSTYSVAGKFTVNTGIDVPAEADKLIKGEWATFGGLRVQIVRDSTVSVNVEFTGKTK